MIFVGDQQISPFITRNARFLELVLTNDRDEEIVRNAVFTPDPPPVSVKHHSGQVSWFRIRTYRAADHVATRIELTWIPKPKRLH
jgi:hypothetical protein